MNDNSYTRKLIDLSVRVNLLEKKVDEKKINLESIQDEINRCESLLSIIYEHAQCHEIDLGSYSGILIQVETKLRYAKERFQKRMLKKNSRCKKILSVFRMVLRVINTILTILGIGPLLALPGKEYPRLSE